MRERNGSSSLAAAAWSTWAPPSGSGIIPSISLSIKEIGRGDFQRVRGYFGFRGIPPHDRSASLRRNHRINGIFEHQHAVANGDCQRAARSPLARDRDDDRHGQARHFAQVVGDGFGLAAFLRVHSGIGAGRIDENKNGPAKFCRELHGSQRFAIALRFCLSEIAGHALLRVAPLLAADDHHRPSVIPSHAGN